MRISDWSSDVCSSDLEWLHDREPVAAGIDLSQDWSRLRIYRNVPIHPHIRHPARPNERTPPGQDPLPLPGYERGAGTKRRPARDIVLARSQRACCTPFLIHALCGHLSTCPPTTSVLG